MKLAAVESEKAPEAEPPRYELIERLFFVYRDFVADADRALAGDGFGRAHHRVLYFAARRSGLTIAELLDILQITKQSLNRVLNDLLARGYVVSRLGEADKRQRRLYATPRGNALVQRIAEIQTARFERAFARLGPGAEGTAAAFLAAMVDGGHDDQDWKPAARTGFMKGQIGDVPDDFDRLCDDEIARLFGTEHP